MNRLGKSELDGKIETMILGILGSGPGYGYRLIQDLNESAAGLMKLGEGTVYPVLHRMERRGLISPSWRAAKDGRKRKYYRVTPRGRRTLEHNRQQWASLVRVMEGVLGKAASGSNKNLVREGVTHFEGGFA